MMVSREGQLIATSTSFPGLLRLTYGLPLELNGRGGHR